MSDLGLPDIPRLYTALAEWLGCLVYILPMRKRLKGVPLAAVIASGLAVQIGINHIAGMTDVFFWMGWMALAFCSMLALIRVTLKGNINNAVFFAIRAFIAAEFAASFEWQLYCFFQSQGFTAEYWNIVFLVAVYAAVFVSLFFIERRHLPGSTTLNIGGRELFSSVLIGVSVFLMSNISFVFQNTPFSSAGRREIFYIRTLVDFVGLVILYAQLEMRRETDLRRELETMDNLLQRQYDQYRISKENDEMISRKYHDLKHQIHTIRAETDPVKREEHLQEMDVAIKLHEADNRTGNSVLDTVLFGKSLYCARHGIQFTCIADGAVIDFMSVMDICTIFGNALDNAIECAEKLDDPEQRIICMSVQAQNAFAILRFENYFDPAMLVMDAGLPVTTKDNAEYHGYGIKSIRAAVETYDGCLTINTQDNWFCLNILIPLTKSAAFKKSKGTQEK